MASVVTVNYALTQSINLVMEFLLIFLTDIPKSFIHSGKLNDMLAHIRVLTKKISILVSKLLEESSENNINKADFSAPDFLQEIERMKGEDIRQIFLKAPESSQLRFPMDDGFFFMNILLRHLNDLLISNTYSVSLIKNEIGMVKECLEFLRSSFGKVRQILDDTSGVVKDLGHEKEESQIIDQLLDEHESELDVISIVGMPGLGKTTLANKQVTGSEEKGSEDDFAEKLRRALLDKRYLIVLDDVWDIATREMLISCFPKFK
ncbi:hypothetical protein RDI58_026718 [Solanum bulbocastanum]|uniref:NB-ARC domain-containing protein n=1 Tax=Solanum bulbocastanum TaxID=147425 RepID=A0AAN8SWX1_SOLBU